MQSGGTGVDDVFFDHHFVSAIDAKLSPSNDFIITISLLTQFPYVTMLELVSKELIHFGVIADLFRQIGGHSSRFVLFCSF